MCHGNDIKRRNVIEFDTTIDGTDTDAVIIRIHGIDLYRQYRTQMCRKRFDKFQTGMLLLCSISISSSSTTTCLDG